MAYGYTLNYMKILAENKKALFDYEILETIEAGLKLSGHEVKSAKMGQINLKGAFVNFHKDEAWLTGAYITKYKMAGNLPDYEPDHTRKLLLHHKQISYLQGKQMEKGLTIVPLKVYTSDRLIKVEIGIGRGRKKYDKKEVLKKRDVDREIRRVLKNG